jgi:hypothetical protein
MIVVSAILFALMGCAIFPKIDEADREKFRAHGARPGAVLGIQTLQFPGSPELASPGALASLESPATAMLSSLKNLQE